MHIQKREKYTFLIENTLRALFVWRGSYYNDQPTFSSSALNCSSNNSSKVLVAETYK